MAGSLSITTTEFDFKALISIINTIFFAQSHKRKSTKIIKRKENRADCENKKGTAPYQKRERNSESVQA